MQLEDFIDEHNVQGPARDLEDKCAMAAIAVVASREAKEEFQSMYDVGSTKDHELCVSRVRGAWVQEMVLFGGEVSEPCSPYFEPFVFNTLLEENHERNTK